MPTLNKPLPSHSVAAARRAAAGGLGAVVSALLAGCITLSPTNIPSEHHLKPPAKPSGEPPALAPSVPQPPKPTAASAQRPERYSVVVNKTPVQDILFVIARDAKLNIDLHPGITGTVTMSAIDQTLTEILDRISRQVDMRYELDGRNLTVLPDSPFLRHYRVEYLNIGRDSKTSMASATSVSGGSGGGNSSSNTITNTSQNHYWDTLVGNLRDLLRETDKIIPGSGSGGSTATGGSGAGSAGGSLSAAVGAAVGALSGGGAGANGGNSGGNSGNGGDNAGKTNSGSGNNSANNSQNVTFREAASVIANPEGGVISVRATSKQHQKVREFIDKTVANVRRQVLIEGTIIEVDLSDEFQQGINWSLLNQSGSVNIQVSPQSGALPSGVPIGGIFPNMAAITLAKQGLTSSKFDFTSAIRMLESFGRARVLSSPKLSVLNNQPAMLRVVDNLVYFTVSGTYTPASTAGPASVAVTSTANTVSVGFTLGVTPQIGADDEVTLMLRPTISRVLSYVDDPAIGIFMALAKAGGTNLPEVVSRVPQIQSREMESVIKVRGGMTAVLGGLMRDSGSNATDGIPGADALGFLGDLLKYKKRSSTKSELVIFLRPVIVTDASLDGDYAPWRTTLGEATAVGVPGDRERAPQ